MSWCAGFGGSFYDAYFEVKVSVRFSCKMCSCYGDAWLDGVEVLVD